MNNRDIELFKNVMRTYISDLENKYESSNTIDADTMATDIELSLQKSMNAASQKSSISRYVPKN